MAESVPEMNDLVMKAELLSIMECPVCQEIPFPPIYQCVRGHNICNTCRPKLKECPTCRGSFLATRNYTVEKLVLASKHSCIYKEDGCQIELRGELMEKHMIDCSYRPFKCPWFGQSNCSNNLLKLTLAKDHVLHTHMSTMSSTASTVGPTILVNYRLRFDNLTDIGALRRLKANATWSANSTEFDGKVFLLHLFSLKQTICFSVLCIDTEEEARKYRVKIICQPDKEMEMQWTVTVRSISKGAELKNPETRHKVFLSTCTLDDLIQMAEIREGDIGYTFCTRYTIFKR